MYVFHSASSVAQHLTCITHLTSFVRGDIRNTGRCFITVRC